MRQCLQARPQQCWLAEIGTPSIVSSAGPSGEATARLGAETVSRVYVGSQAAKVERLPTAPPRRTVTTLIAGITRSDRWRPGSAASA